MSNRKDPMVNPEKTRSKRGGMVLVAVAAAFALLVASAQAANLPRWYTGTGTGSLLTTQEPAAFKLGVNGEIGKKLEILYKIGTKENALELQATGVECVGTCSIENYNNEARALLRLKMTGITVTGVSGCTVSSEGNAGVIETEPLVWQLGPEGKGKLTPRSGSVLWEWELVGTECAFAGNMLQGGYIALDMQNKAGVQATEQPVIIDSADSYLPFAGTGGKTRVRGTIISSLASGKPFGYHF